MCFRDSAKHPSDASGGPTAAAGMQTLNLNDDPDGDHTYAGFDRRLRPGDSRGFGRVVDQTWEDDTPATLDQSQYGYDRAACLHPGASRGSRTCRDNTQTTLRDWKYTDAGLNRLDDVRRAAGAQRHDAVSELPGAVAEPVDQLTHAEGQDHDRHPQAHGLGLAGPFETERAALQYGHL